MVQVPATESSAVHYPDSDGQPMADNTKQFRWIVVIEQNLERLFADDPDVFVAGDLLWYPVEGNNKIRQAPDALVVFGRPKGDRGSYQQWKENNIPPQVVFEVLSPGNTRREMERKLLFYDRYGVEEYYVYDPDSNDFNAWLRSETGELAPIELTVGWTSPRLSIWFNLASEELQIYTAAGQPFLSYVEVTDLLEAEQQRAETAQQQAEAERQRAEEERQRAEQAEARAAEIEALLQQYRDRFGELPE
ncbi:MAG: Uma2 family endonuclease [Leptolyngbyaceae cyanobacterium bins.302]|nr:Uma2 family endonuclease [Leptolyngbyaceae cyanobacterium bins.302]